MDSSFEYVNDVIEHISNVWEFKDKNFNLDGCYEIHDDFFEIEVDKEDKSIFIKFNIITLPSVVSELTRNLLDFCYEHGFLLIIGDDFFVENDKKLYGTEANNAFNRMIYDDVKIAVENEKLFEELLYDDGLTEC